MAQPSAATDVSLEGLPQELLVRIASFLTTAELGPLRRSCKNIERQLFDTFAHEFFTKRQFIIEEESLEALLGISRHPGLAAKLSEVIISADALQSDEKLLNCRALTGCIERGALLSTGLARDMLVEIFSNLPNLRTVGLRDYDGAGRIRDGQSARWRSWGWSLSSGVLKDRPDALLPLLLASLAQAKARPTNVEVFLRHAPHLRHESFRMPSRSTGNAVASVLAELKTLMLTISADANHNESLAPWSVYNDDNYEEVPLRRFLHQSSKLESLRLNFDNDRFNRQADVFLGYRIVDWLSRPAAASTAIWQPSGMTTPPVRLEFLKSLELGMCNAPVATLVRVLTKFDLESFSLWKMTLQCPGPTSVSSDCWAELFLQLSTNLPASCRIRHIMIGSCKQHYYSTNAPSSEGYLGARLCFAPEGTDPADKEKADKDFKIAFHAQYTGKTVQQWLKEVSERTFVPGFHSVPARQSQFSDSELDSEEDSMDDGDDDEEDDEDAEVLSE